MGGGLDDLTLDQIQGCGLPPAQARDLLQALHRAAAHAEAAGLGQAELWREVSKAVLKPAHPFELHRLLLRAVFSGWDTENQGPLPLWTPTRQGAADTNAAALMAQLTHSASALWPRHATGDPLRDFPLLHRVSVEEPEVFWPLLFRHFRLAFARQPDRVVQPCARHPDRTQWLPGGALNVAASALFARDPDAPALLWAVEGAAAEVHTLTLGELGRRCRAAAAALRCAGLQPGDAVGIVMPMTVTAVVAYLGCVLAGCPVVSIADSFAPAEIALRLRIARAAAAVTQDVVSRGGKTHPLLAKLPPPGGGPGSLRRIVVLGDPAKGPQAELKPGDILWDDFLEAARDAAATFDPHIADPSSVTNVIFSSGTTGEPKAIPWTQVTPLACARDAWGHMDVRRGDVLAWPTSLGWMMGPWLLFAALLNGAAIALFQGTPLGRDFGVFVAAARVTCLGLVPSIVRAWRGSNCMQGLDWSALRCFASSGEASGFEDYHWLMARAGYKPVIELCGGTEVGGGFISGSLLQPQSPATFTTPTFGCRFVLLTPEQLEAGGSVSAAAQVPQGEIALVAPILGASQRLLNRDNGAIYYKGMPRLAETGTLLRRHGDELARLPGGFWAARGRTDDTLNLSGIKVSSVELERACVAGVPGLKEAAAVGVTAPGGGPEELVVFAVLEEGARESGKELRASCQAAIQKLLNPSFRVSKVVVRSSLPRNASNKVVRRLLRDQAGQQPRL